MTAYGFDHANEVALRPFRETAMKRENFERIFDGLRFVGFISDQGRHGWFVQLVGASSFTAPRYGMTRDEAIAYLKEQTK